LTGPRPHATIPAMPYGIKHREDGVWVIFKRDTGEVVGHSKSRKDAEASIRARYLGEKMSKRRS